MVQSAVRVDPGATPSTASGLMKDNIERRAAHSSRPAVDESTTRSTFCQSSISGEPSSSPGQLSEGNIVKSLLSEDNISEKLTTTASGA